MWVTGLFAGLTAVAMTVVVALGAGHGADTHPGGPGAPAGPASGSRILLAAASAVEKEPSSSAAYWYVEKRGAHLREVPGKDYTLRKGTTHRVWVAAGTTKRWSEIVDTGAQPATPADREAWRADGSPRMWHITDPMMPSGETFTYEGRGVIQQDAPGGKGDVVPLVGFDPAEVQTLPEDPRELRDRIVEIIDEDHNAPRSVIEGMVTTVARHLATELPLTPELRAAVYRLLASEPGVRDIGEVTDREGRTGIAVAIRDRRGGGEERLVFDRETGMPLASESVSKGGAVNSWTVFTEMRWTDEPPPFDEDLFRPPPGE